MREIKFILLYFLDLHRKYMNKNSQQQCFYVYF